MWSFVIVISGITILVNFPLYINLKKFAVLCCYYTLCLVVATTIVIYELIPKVYKVDYLISETLSSSLVSFNISILLLLIFGT